MSTNPEEIETTVVEPSTSQSKVEPEPEKVIESADPEKKGMNQLEIQNETLQFVGLGKEELLILANRPFWVRLRWVLFISFWLLWLALLVGAALIIGLSPGCEDEVKVASSATHHR